MGGTLYEVLGVDPDADSADIAGAFRERVKQTHPDVSDAPDAGEQFKRIRTAKRVLTDADERARYDCLGHETYVQRHLDSERWGVDVSGDAGQGMSSSANGGVSASEAARTVSTSRTETTSKTSTATSSTTTQQRRADGYGTAATYYNPDKRVSVGNMSGAGGISEAIRDVAPWLLAHVALLVSSLIVGSMLLRSGTVDGVPSFTSAVIATTMVGITLCLSLLHITSTLYG